MGNCHTGFAMANTFILVDLGLADAAKTLIQSPTLTSEVIMYPTEIRPHSALLCCVVLATAIAGSCSSIAAPEDRLLHETVEFTGAVTFLAHKVPALVIGAVRNGERAISGFGKISTGSNALPDGKTIFRIGSVTKAFTGAILASTAAEGAVALTDPLEKHLAWDVSVPTREGKIVRLIDLATHSGGFPREVPHEPGLANDPFANITKAAFVASLRKEGLLFAPGTGALYSNMGFDLLAAALAGAGGKPYPELVRERISQPLGMADTVFALNDDQRRRLMQGHDFGGELMPHVPTGSVIVGSGGLYSTVNDILTWLEWHLDAFSKKRRRDAPHRSFGVAAAGRAFSGLRPRRIRPNGRAGPGLDRDDARRASAANPSEGWRPPGNLLLCRVRADPRDRRIHRD
jgi:D-alanyl-D-alanine-carboxypeptidase/D-alanyl-D-alanine-endopeptidase